MARSGHEGRRACSCDRLGGCAGSAVAQLTRERVRELAEQIWAMSTGTIPHAGPSPDPRASQPGASATAAYRHRVEQDRDAWNPGRRAWLAFAATVAFALLIAPHLSTSLAGPTVVLVAVLAEWRLRFRPSVDAAAWRWQAALQRRTAELLLPLDEEGYLVLHDVTLPGWPVGIGHVVVGETGVWVIESSPGRWTPLWLVGVSRRIAPWRGSEAEAVVLHGLNEAALAVANALAVGGVVIPVQPLLCVHVGDWLGGRHAVDRAAAGFQAAPSHQLAEVIRHGSSLAPQSLPRHEIERAAARAVEVLRPAV